MTAREFAEGLREAAAWWDAHPDVPAPTEARVDVWVDDRETFARIARQVGHAEKDTAGSIYWLRVATGVCRVDFNIARSEVCERRVIGTKVVPRQVVEEHEEEVVEWDCGSIFAPSAVGQAPRGAEAGDPQRASVAQEDMPF